MMTGNPPSYLVRNPYPYCFRIKIPKDLQAIVSKKELRYSLGTGNLSAAKNKARYLAGHYADDFEEAIEKIIPKASAVVADEKQLINPF